MRIAKAWGLVAIVLGICAPIVLLLGLPHVAQFIPHTFTQRFLRDALTVALLLSPCLMATGLVGLRLKRWYTKLLLGLPMLVLALLYWLALAKHPLHSHCWQPQAFLEASTETPGCE
jgi:hypothetical protein